MNSVVRIAVSVVAMVVLLAANTKAEENNSYSRKFIPEGRSERIRREKQDKFGKVPEEILKRQSIKRMEPPSIDLSITIALKAASKEASSLIDTTFHKGKRFVVPDDYKTIQNAINAAGKGDVVVVKPGIYYEMILMKDGVKLLSDSTNGGDDLEALEGARLKLPRRTLRTIIDGSRGRATSHGMIDFNDGIGRNTIVDGFTIQNLPRQNHHIPGHAHAINIRGASPVIINCLVQKNGSTGIGNHVVYADQNSYISKRDFRWANVKYKVRGVIYHSIVRENLGLGIGFNHFSAPYVLGNDVSFNNDAELGQVPSPGMGAKHGAAPKIIGNIVHDNPGGGILSKVGQPQGIHHIDRPTHPTIMKNVVYSNGKLCPAIGSYGAGSKQMPVRIIGNFIYDAGSAGIGISKQAVAVIEDNIISGSAKPGISINAATALNLNRNTVTMGNTPGFLITGDANVLEMTGNAAYWNRGPRFLLRDDARVERPQQPQH